MNKMQHRAHKVLAIVLMLVVFSIPFYIERAQIGSLNNNAYMIGAVIRNSQITPQKFQHKTVQNSQIKTATSVIGQTFLSN